MVGSLGESPAGSGRADLLSRFVPVLRYDSNEAFFADAVEEMVENPSVRLLRAGAKEGRGETIADGATLTLDFLDAGRYANGAVVLKGDHFSDERRDYREQASEGHARAELADVVYGREQLDGEGRNWLQYWFFYLYNDAQFGGRFGLHEGDWEMIELRMGAAEPDLAVYAQHAYAESRAWSEVEKTPEGAAVVYPGRGSHASYFEPGLHRTEVLWDIADGRREARELRLVRLADPLPGWVLWPGIWGDTQPRIPQIESSSPPGPVGHAQWHDPKALLEKARGHERREPPPVAGLRARRRRDRLAIDYRLAGAMKGLGTPDRLVVTVNSPLEEGPPETYTFTVDSAVEGRIVTRRELDPRHAYDVRMGLIDADGKPSASERVDLPALGLGGRLLDYLRAFWDDIEIVRRSGRI